MAKRIIISKCPAINDSLYCNKHNCLCKDIVDCIMKQLTYKPLARINYIKNKLCSCMGYSDYDKIIRYEEQEYITKEFKTILGINVVEDSDDVSINQGD